MLLTAVNKRQRKISYLQVPSAQRVRAKVHAVPQGVSCRYHCSLGTLCIYLVDVRRKTERERGDMEGRGRGRDGEDGEMEDIRGRWISKTRVRLWTTRPEVSSPQCRGVSPSRRTRQGCGSCRP